MLGPAIKSERESKSTSRFCLIDATGLIIKGIFGKPALQSLNVQHFPFANVPVQNVTSSEQFNIFRAISNI